MICVNFTIHFILSFIFFYSHVVILSMFFYTSRQSHIGVSAEPRRITQSNNRKNTPLQTRLTRYKTPQQLQHRFILPRQNSFSISLFASAFHECFLSPTFLPLLFSQRGMNKPGAIHRQTDRQTATCHVYLYTPFILFFPPCVIFTSHPPIVCKSR